MVYYFDDIESVDEQFINKTNPLLSSERISKVERLKNFRDKQLSVVAYLLLLYGLKIRGIKPYAIRFLYGENGKPYLFPESNVFFNISHCKNGAACIISSDEVGIDIQEVDSVDEAVIKQVCSNDESRCVLSSKDKDFQFIKLWTMKESYLKAIGKGIITDLKKVNFVEISNQHSTLNGYILKSYNINNYVVSICKRDMRKETIEKVTIKEIVDFINESKLGGVISE